jgi:hypothetical protein
MINKIRQSLNKDRLRVYPRLFFFANWSILIINIFLHNGWVGGLGQIIGIDYLLFYSTGLVYRLDPSKIYNFDLQEAIQRRLIFPTELPAVNPYFNPPYVALPHSLLTYIPFPSSLLLWSGISAILIIISGKLLHPLLPSSVKQNGLTLSQFILVIFSFFPFFEGFQAGQNHSFTLLLVTVITIFSISERWYLAGIAAGLLLYKPQFALGFLIIWLFARKFKAVVAFSMVGITWIGIFLLQNGISLFHDYLVVSSMLLKLPYDEGFPTYLLATPYGLLASALPESLWLYINRGIQAFFIIGSVLIARQAYLERDNSGNKIIYLYGMAILFPLLATPYVLLHDLLILIPFFVILSKVHTSKTLLLVIAGTYIGALLLPLIGYLLNIAAPALITIGIAIYFLKNMGDIKYQMVIQKNEDNLGG